MAKIIFTIFIILILPITIFAGSMPIKISEDTEGESISIKIKDEVQHLALSADFKYKQESGIVKRNRGKINISTNPVLKDKNGDKTDWSIWGAFSAFYDNPREIRGNTVAGGPQYRINENWLSSFGLVYRSEVGKDSRGLISSRLTGNIGFIELKYTYKFNTEESRDYENEFELKIPLSERWGIYHWREKIYQMHGDRQTDIGYNFTW